MKFWSLTTFLFSLFGYQIESPQHNYTSEIGKIFGKGSKVDVQEVFILTNLLIDSILEDRMNELVRHIDSGTGIYVDVKAHWSIERFKYDLKDNNGYLAKFFISSSKLQAYKKDKVSLASSDELRKSNRYRMDFFFEGDECHVQIHFLENPNAQSNINNPIFIKLRGKWYFLRLL